MVVETLLGIQTARRATVRVIDRSKQNGHRGQGLLLDLDGEEAFILTCHHVIAPVSEDNLHVEIPRSEGGFSEPLPARYDVERSHPEKDAVVLRVRGAHLAARPLLHELDLESYNGTLEAIVLTHLVPNNFTAQVAPSVRLNLEALGSSWPNTPERYDLRAFRLRTPDDAREGVSGGVVLCEDGVLGLVHFARAEGELHAREDYLVPLSAWSDGWQALAERIEPLIDRNLRGAATVKRARQLGVQRNDQLELAAGSVIAGFREDIYVERGFGTRVRAALEQRRGIAIVGKPKSGKTRLVWQLLQERPELVVVIPDPGRDRPPDAFEPSGFSGREIALFLDDLHRTAETIQPNVWRRRLEEASGRSCLVFCTSRDGKDWERVTQNQQLLLDELGSEAVVYTSKIVDEWGVERGDDLSPEEGRELAAARGLSEATFQEDFDGTPGSLLLDLRDMRRRYSNLRSERQGGLSMSRLLDSAKLLYEARQPVLRGSTLRAVAEEIRGDGQLSSEAWDELQRRTIEEGFGWFSRFGNLETYRPYLEQCVAYSPWDGHQEDFDQLLPILEREQDFVGLYYLALTYHLDLDDNERSLACYERALALSPNYFEAWNDKSFVLEKLGRYHEALAAADEGLRIKPNASQIWNNKGMALLRLGRNEQAVEAFVDALRIEPNYHDAWNNIGIAYARIDRHVDALGAFYRALRLRPDDPIAWHSVGLALGTLGRFDKASQYYDQALKRDPDYYEALVQQGIALSRLGQHDRALWAHNRAIELRPSTAEAWNNKGVTLADLGRLEEALEAFDEALRLRPEFPAVWYSKGLQLAKLGWHAEAVGWLCRAWRARDQLPDNGRRTADTLRSLGRNPLDCEQT